MNHAEDAMFFKQRYPTMVRMGLKFGASHVDAEDAASAVAECVRRSWTHWTAAKDKRCYLRKAIKHELGRTGKKSNTQQAREAGWAQDMLWSRPRDSTADSYDQVCELDGVRQDLAILTARQRETFAWLYLGQQAGWQAKDIADELGIRPATVRRHLQNARDTLKPFHTGNGHEHRRSLRAAERIHEDFHHGHTNPFGPRPIILKAWELARKRGLNPKRGTVVDLLDPNELHQRRDQSPFHTRSPILAELVDLAACNELLAVVLDVDSIVLHRGGHPNALAAADRLGMVDSARWDLDHAGVNAAGLAQILGRPTTVNRFEHTFPDQPGLCCLAIPIRLPHGGYITLNLTATTDTLTTVPRALYRELDTIARRLHRQMWTPRRR